MEPEMIVVPSLGIVLDFERWYQEYFFDDKIVYEDGDRSYFWKMRNQHKVLTEVNGTGTWVSKINADAFWEYVYDISAAYQLEEEYLNV